jgi:serine/threonine protein kinase
VYQSILAGVAFLHKNKIAHRYKNLTLRIFCRFMEFHFKLLIFTFINCVVIGRDLKPANILLQSASHQLKISDFGLAKANQASSNGNNTRGVGSPVYMVRATLVCMSLKICCNHLTHSIDVSLRRCSMMQMQMCNWTCLLATFTPSGLFCK